jgi:CSLREA domain-containing protein
LTTAAAPSSLPRLVPGRARLLPVVAFAVLALGVPAAAHAADINVTTSTDESSGGNGCSLREAVIASNADSTGTGSDCIKGSGADVIHVPASATPYKLTNAGTPPEEAAATGDLDITDDVTIVGPGATKATVDGNKTDRVFDIHPARRWRSATSRSRTARRPTAPTECLGRLASTQATPATATPA